MEVFMHWGHGPWMWLAGLANAAFWIAIIVLVVALVRRRPSDRPIGGHRPRALELLEERYARGEVTREEFVERRDVILGRSTQAGGGGTTPPS